MYSHIRKKDSVTPVVIDAKDTDVVVLAVQAARKVKGTVGMERKKEIYDCNNFAQKKYPELLCLFIYIHELMLYRASIAMERSLLQKKS